jgi:hypothetical protein
MFDVEACNFEELAVIKKQHDLEILLDFYKDIKIIYKVYRSNKLIGVILFNEYKFGLQVEYFEIFNNERNKGFGTKFISWMLNELNITLYLTPLPEAENFWIRCGFTHRKENAAIMCYRPSL